LKKILLLFIQFFIALCAFCQSAGYWQQRTDYSIKVSLNDTAHTLDGQLHLKYQNNSPDTLTFIWIHLWPNAYKNDKTAFSDQRLENGQTDFYFSDEEKRGYINRLAFKVDGVSAEAEDHPAHQDIIKLVLPHALPPGRSTEIETPFHVKFPYNFSRSGYVGRSFMATQWYPKPAVYDRKGWHEMPYLDQGEFYSEFGSFDVQVTVPVSYKVAATGKRLNETSDGDKTTFHFAQDKVHDFAWFADKDFVVLHDTLRLATKTIDVYAYYFKQHEAIWKNSLQFIKNSITTKSEWLGEYPYDIVTVVDNIGDATGGGMEYPTITTVETPGSERLLDFVINHEVGHNWFYGILASNERQHPWMDEGMNTYYDNRYEQLYYGNSNKEIDTDARFLQKMMPDNLEHNILQTVTSLKKDQPIETPSATFNMMNYGIVAYEKTGEWMKLLEEQLGKTVFDSCMKAYYERWKFRHPYPEDFKKVMEEVSGNNLDASFALLSQKGSLTKKQKKDLKLTPFFSLKDTDKHNYIGIAPALGYNFYDKFMIGAVIHNYSMPLSRFHFVAVPLYATGSSSFNGIGRAGYTVYTGSKGQRLELAGTVARFTGGSFKDSTGKTNYQPYTKIVPSLRYTFANKDPRSHVTKYIQFKTFLITETGLSFKRDTINDVDVIAYPKEKRYVNQLKLVFENNRVLYPYKIELQTDQGEGFVRTGLTAEYYFNFTKGGGLNLRFFAGKFFYTGDKTFTTQFQTDRYHLNLSGANGSEDYTYSNYFYGRNEFEGVSTQQIMIRDGAFKVRTDLLSSKIGKTDNWLSAFNINTDIPKQINPLNILPIKIPLKIFADVGTYAEAWKKNAGTGKFLYDAGLQISLFKNTVNVYFPILYSKVFDDYFKSTITEKRFSKNIAFSIDIQNINLKRYFPQITL